MHRSRRVRLGHVARGRPKLTKIGLVLGAGGVVGQAYHAGVLSALAEHTGWDPRAADVTVGSSAGAVTGAVLRLGGSASDMAAYATDQPLSPDGAALFATFGPRERDFPPFAVATILRGWRAPSPRAALGLLRRPWALRPASALATLLPAGQVDITQHTAVLDAHVGHSAWPDGLLVCTVRRSDGRRVVLGRPGAPATTLGRAVAASCAIPGYFTPVRIGDHEYVDGGAHSPTNADVLVRERLDLVVVVSPMSAKGGRATAPGGLMRLAAHRALWREVAQLRATGTEVICFEPEREALAVMGVNAMAEDRSSGVVEAAAAETHRRLSDPRLAVRLDHLSGHRVASRAA